MVHYFLPTGWRASRYPLQAVVGPVDSPTTVGGSELTKSAWRPARSRSVKGTVMANPIPLSPAIRAGDFIYVSGMVAKDGDTFGDEDFETEVERTLDAIEEALAPHGADLSHVVKIGAYLSNPLLFDQFNGVYAKRFGDHKPTRTTVAVTFANPWIRVEMDAVAHLG